MAGSAEMLAAFRELTNTKQLDRHELKALLEDGIHAALARKFGPTAKFEMSVDELRGGIRVVRLRQVVETIEDPAWQISVDDARDVVLQRRVPLRQVVDGGVDAAVAQHRAGAALVGAVPASFDAAVAVRAFRHGGDAGFVGDRAHAENRVDAGVRAERGKGGVGDNAERRADQGADHQRRAEDAPAEAAA